MTLCRGRRYSRGADTVRDNSGRYGRKAAVILPEGKIPHGICRLAISASDNLARSNVNRLGYVFCLGNRCLARRH